MKLLLDTRSFNKLQVDSKYLVVDPDDDRSDHDTKSLTNESNQSLDSKNSVVSPAALQRDDMREVNDNIIQAANDIIMLRSHNERHDFDQNLD